MRAFFIVVATIVALATVAVASPHTDPDFAGIYFNRHGDIELSVPKDFDCNRGCKQELCTLVTCLAWCYAKREDERNGTLVLSKAGLERAYAKDLPWYEKKIAPKPEKVIALMDGKDGSPIDGEATLMEFLKAGVPCYYYQLAEDHLCKRCKKRRGMRT